MPLDHIELASLNVPDDPQTRARFAELTRPGGVELQPAETYEARDPGALITVTVNRAHMVTNVRIRPRWYEQMRPEAFPAALYNTYITAVQRALAVESAHRPQSQDSPSTPPSPGASSVDPAELSLEEFMARTRSRLDAIDAEYDAIRRQEQALRVDMAEIRSPLGYLTMRVRDGGPISIHGNPQALDNPSDTVLAEDVLHLFARAGFGVEPGERPRPAARPRSSGDDADEEYFGGFKVVTSDLRQEANLWRERADKAEPVVQAVRDAYLTAPAFFVGDLTTLAAGIVNAELESGQYEDFRAFMEKVLQGAVTEFNQIDVMLRKIADEYDRTDSANEIDLEKFYRV